ncbi:MAG: GGDEF domain-containing protein [Elusimicrobiota bacterium]
MNKLSDEKTPHDKRTYAILGILLGLGSPIGWLIWRVFDSHPLWIKNELSSFGLIYAYMTMGTVIAFTSFGYFLGRKSDLLTKQSSFIKEKLEEVNEMAITDSLTGIHNARYLHDQLSIEIESAKRYETPLTCLMLDIDDFKKINDMFGHPAGDIVLTTLSKIIKQCVRRVDIMGRLGGEEFLVIMPHTLPETAFSVAERIRQAVQRWPFDAEGTPIPVTVSIGIGYFPSKEINDKGALLKATDEALYEAKRTGKNKTIVSDLIQKKVNFNVIN